MPQLDKVTLFSQVFWLLFLYFSFFLILLKYFLPTFSKLFKIRAHFLVSQSEFKTASILKFTESSQILHLLAKFENNLTKNLALFQKYFHAELKVYGTSFFKKINKLFISVYIKNCINFNLYKKLYL